ncbi:MAG: D-glycero-alpha-D-manno-heptose-1,7-bisphosphate 7-phosphatase [Pyrinomonadaceae bacterium]
MFQKPAIFLDRDGTLVQEVNYLSRVEDLRLFPFTRAAIRAMREAGFLLIVITNQSGIGRGIYDEEAMHSVHRRIQYHLEGSIDRFYFCPHLPCDGCQCRKPGQGMIEAARKDFEINISDSWMIGDKAIDIETGQGAGMRTALVLTGYGAAHKNLLVNQPDIVADDLMGATRAIVDQPQI